MDINNIITFMAVATLLVISPGPNGLLIAKTVPLAGKKAGFANIWGFVTAFYLHGTLSIFGISLLLVQSAYAFTIFKTLGAAYLIWIGVKALMSAFKSNSASVSSDDVNAAPHSSAASQADTTSVPASTTKAYMEGLLTNALNPKVSMFYLAAFPQFISVDASAINAYALVSAHALINVVWFALMVMMLSRVKSVANSAHFKKWLNSVTGVIFIGFGSKLALMKSSY